MTKRSIETEFVHAGERRPLPVGLPNATPIFANSTYSYESMEEAERVFTGDLKDYIYTRYGNPTVDAFQDAICTLEGGAVARAYASGMAALHAALLASDLAPGAVILATRDLYGASFDLILNVFGPFGVKMQLVDFTDLDELKRKTDELQPRVLLAETISNPLLKVLDITAVANIAHAVGAKVIVDSTFATPYLARPLNFGADLVVHSATKYLGGQCRRDGRSRHRPRRGGRTGTHQHHETRRRRPERLGSTFDLTRLENSRSSARKTVFERGTPRRCSFATR